LLAHSTIPAISINSTVAGTFLAQETTFRNNSKRSSFTLTIPIFGSIVQNGKFSALAEYDLVSTLKRVDFHTFGNHTIQTFIFLN
jgi:hypothetical protein